MLNKIDVASAAKLRSIFQNLQIKTENYSSPIFFLKQCKRPRLTPSFVKCSVKCSFLFVKSKIEKWVSEKWICSKIRRWYGLLNSNSMLIYYAHSRLSFVLHSYELDRFLGYCHHKVESQRRLLKTKNMKKLQGLILQRDGNQGAVQAHKFYNRLVNKSGTVLFENEEEWLKPVFPNCPKSKKSIFQETEKTSSVGE